MKFEIKVPKNKARRIRDLAKEYGLKNDLTVKASRATHSVLTMRKETTRHLPIIWDFFQKVAPMIKGSEQDKQIVHVQYTHKEIRTLQDVREDYILFWEGTAWSFQPYVQQVSRLTDPRHLGLDIAAHMVPVGIRSSNRKPFEIKGVIQGNTKSK